LNGGFSVPPMWSVPPFKIKEYEWSSLRRNMSEWFKKPFSLAIIYWGKWKNERKKTFK